MPQQQSIQAIGDGRYLASVPSLDGQRSVVLGLAQATTETEGRLKDDEATARAALAFLLKHQDGNDLPQQIEIEEILAAYDDAVEAIAALRS